MKRKKRIKKDCASSKIIREIDTYLWISLRRCKVKKRYKEKRKVYWNELQQKLEQLLEGNKAEFGINGTLLAEDFLDVEKANRNAI